VTLYSTPLCTKCKGIPLGICTDEKYRRVDPPPPHQYLPVRQCLSSSRTNSGMHVFGQSHSAYGRSLRTPVQKTQDRQCRSNAILRRILLDIVAMEMQKHVPLVLLTYICRCQQCNEYWKRCHGKAIMRSIYCCARHVAADNMKHT
jgi:hypothetical protein